MKLHHRAICFIAGFLACILIFNHMRRRPSPPHVPALYDVPQSEATPNLNVHGRSRITYDELQDVIAQYLQQNASCSESTSRVTINPFAAGVKGYLTVNPEVQEAGCVDIHFSAVNLPKTALVSYQGSGNTWTRHLIQQLTGEG